MKERKPKGYWSYEKCKEVALGCDSKGELSKKHPSVYSTIYKNKWTKLFEHMKISYEMDWSYENCKLEALKYKHRIDLKNSCNTVYRKILKKGWLELFEHMKNTKTKPKRYWTYEKCKEEALKYDNNENFYRYSSTAYNKINKMGWSELKLHIKLKGNKYNRLVYVYEFTDNHFYVGLTYNIEKRKKKHSSSLKSSVYKHIKNTNLVPKLIIKTDYINIEDAVIMEGEILNQYLHNNWIALNRTKTGGLGGNQKIWNNENTLIESLKYNTYKDFYTNSSGAYGYMMRHNIDCEHLEKAHSPNGYWCDKEKCEIESKKYKNRSEFSKKCYTAYNYSRINSWLDEFYPPKNKYQL